MSKLSQIRITSGQLKGRKLSVPAPAHPMGSREKLALFNTLGPSIYGKVFLDLFAGSGALGIEALSRGADFCVFVEKDRSSANIITENLKDLGLSEKALVVKASAEQFVFSDAFKKAHFDFILADPPYSGFSQLSPELFQSLINSTDSFVLSHPTSFQPQTLGLSPRITKKYAGAQLSFFTTG